MRSARLEWAVRTRRGDASRRQGASPSRLLGVLCEAPFPSSGGQGERPFGEVGVKFGFFRRFLAVSRVYGEPPRGFAALMQGG